MDILHIGYCLPLCLHICSLNRVCDVLCRQPGLIVDLGHQHKLTKCFKSHTDCHMVFRRITELWDN
mgnify:CR=1 FL=1